MRVIGTAGHVDHGKSTLVRALTGMNPDRLKEEQEREMTIDLGFAWMTLPSGESVSIVDVPGHEDFIKNMLAGVGSIDAAVLVIAADEGVMPQTREHLAILDLLEIKTGVVALTKADLIFDPEWIELVKMDIMEVLEGTALENVNIIPVSARLGRGLPELKAEIDRLLHNIPPRRDLNRARLPVDRVFTLPGFGTIVTGTLSDGQFKVGEEVEVLPRRLKARIRGLQTHKTRVETALPGSRVAVNLTGIRLEDVQRGDVIAHPGWLRPTTLLDAQIEMLLTAPKPLAHNVEVLFFCGSAEIQAHTRVLGASEIAQGDTGWVQLRLSSEAAVVKGDRFILRQPSPALTIGGGLVVEPYPGRRHRRFSEEVLQRLETLAHGGHGEMMLMAVQRGEPGTGAQAIQLSGLGAAPGAAALAELVKGGLVLVLEGDAPADGVLTPNTLIISAEGWARLLDNVEDLVGDYHRQYPLRAGMPREELKSRLRMQPRAFQLAMDRAENEGALRGNATTIHLPEHKADFTPGQRAQVDRMVAALAHQPYTPPSVNEIESALGADVFNALLEQRVLTKVNAEVCFLTDVYEEMVRRVVDHMRANGKITVAEVRDMFNASRKYALGLMEHLDERKITRRMGDERVLR